MTKLLKLTLLCAFALLTFKANNLIAKNTEYTDPYTRALIYMATFEETDIQSVKKELNFMFSSMLGETYSKYTRGVLRPITTEENKITFSFVFRRVQDRDAFVNKLKSILPDLVKSFSTEETSDNDSSEITIYTAGIYGLGSNKPVAITNKDDENQNAMQLELRVSQNRTVGDIEPHPNW